MGRWTRVVAVLILLGLVGAACTPSDPNPGNPGGGLASWKELRPAAVALSDGRLAVFKVNAAGRLEWRVQETNMASTSYRYVGWIAAQTIGAGPVLAGSPSAVLNADNTLTVVAVGADGVMYATRQTLVDAAVPASSFGAWTAMPVIGNGVTFSGSPTSIEINNDALRDVIVLGSDGKFYTSTQTTGPDFGPWTAHDGPGRAVSGPVESVVRNDGLVELWVRGTTDGSYCQTLFNRATGQWAGSFDCYTANPWRSMREFLISPSGRLVVVGTNEANELLVQPLLPTGTESVKATGVTGTPGSVKSGTSTYLFAIRTDGRVQVASVDDAGSPGVWHVIDQPPTPELVSPSDGAVMYVGAEINLVGNPVMNADEYRFELYELVNGGRQQIGQTTAPLPTWKLPAGTLTAGKNYQWTIRAWNNTTQLLSDYRTYGIVASNQTSEPTRVAPAENATVDPYGTTVLTAGAVMGADTYTFRVFRMPLGNQVWSSVVAATAAPGQPVSTVIPPSALPTGSYYQWEVDARVGGSNPTASGRGNFLATTGAAGSSMMARTTTGDGYWLLTPNGYVAGYGDARFSQFDYQPAGYLPGGWRTIGIVARPRSTTGYWVLADSGAVYSYGGAPYFGGANGQFPAGAGWKAVGMAPTTTGNGYWIVADSGAVYTFGDAGYEGGANGLIPAGEKAVSITPRPDGNGYWILANKGAVYGLPTHSTWFGNAPIPGPDLPAVGLQSTPTGDGYTILSRKGGIYNFGKSDFHGAANTPKDLNGNPAAGFASAPNNSGYWVMQDWVGPNGGAMFTYGPVGYFGGGNVPPSVSGTAAQPSTPLNGTRFFPRTPSGSPTLTLAGGTGANGRMYRFFLGTDPQASTEIVADSGWQWSPAWIPPPQVLKDGRTYYWRASSRDTGNVNPPVLDSPIAYFSVNRRFGSSGPAPYEAVGPVSVNLASGNATTSWASPSVNGAGVSLTYNSLAPIETAEPGLPIGWSASWTSDASAQSLIVAGGTATVTMVDGSKENFSWRTGTTSGNSWLSVDGSDSTLTETTGPAESRWVYTTADGTVHEFDVLGRLTHTYKPVDERRSSAMTYAWSDTPIGRRMTAAKDPVSGREMRLYFQGDGQNGCASTPPQGSSAAPRGYLCRVRLMDDRTYDVGYAALASGIVQLGSIVGSDTSATSWAWEVANSAALGGQYPRLVGITDPLASDAIAAGKRSADSTVRTELTYQPDGRVVSVTRPAPALGAVRQVVRIAYSANGATVNRDGDQRPNGYSRQVEADDSGRQTLERDQAGRVTTTGWRTEAPGDIVAWSQDPAGMRVGTTYDDQWKETAKWGPAPITWFDASSAANQWGAIPSAANQAATPVTTTAYDGGLNGLAQSFFGTADLTGGVKRRAIQAGASFNIETAGWDGLPADGFSMRAEGLLTPTVSGVYTFHTDSDGGARIYIDDVKVADGWELPDGALLPTPAQQQMGVSLTAGKRVRIRVEYRDLGGNARWDLWWTPPGQAPGWIPTSQMQPNYALVTQKSDLDGRTTAYSYTDPAAGLDPSDGLLVSTTQVVGGGAPDLVTSSTYEPDSETVGWRRQLTRSLPSGSASTVSYDYYADAGDPVANSCGVGAGTSQAGRPRSTTAADPDGAGPERAIKRWYVYDTAGRTRGLLTTTADVAAGTLGSQSWVCTTYDERGRPTKVTYPAFGGTSARTVTSDYSNPLETRITDPAGTIVATVDLLGRTTKYSDVWGTETTSSYDVAGRPTGSSMAGQTTAMAYQPDGLLDTMSINGKVVADTTYDGAGRMTGVAYPAGANAAGNGSTGEFGYDVMSRPAAVAWRGPGGTLLASENVRRMKSGNLVERWYDGNDLNGSNPDFAYDGAGRLTSAVIGSTTHTYGFGDAAACSGAPQAGRNSNRSTKTVGGATTTYCYDAADRLVSSSEPSVGSVSYDSRGNTTSIFGETHTYDIADRHLSTTKGGTTVGYVRDATDRIVERKVNGTSVARYLSAGSGDAPSAVLDVATNQKQFTWVLPGGALFTSKPDAPATSTWTYPNLQGSALTVADQAGAKQGATITWDADGNNVTGGVPDNSVGSFDYGWLGQHQRPLEHEAGLSPMIEMGARQYSPIVGRFLEVDPVEGGTANDYEYVTDPVNQVDLDGRCFGWESLKGRKVCKKPSDRAILRAYSLLFPELFREPIPRNFKLDKSFKDALTRDWKSSGYGLALLQSGGVFDPKDPSAYSYAVASAALDKGPRAKLRGLLRTNAIMLSYRMQPEAS